MGMKKILCLGIVLVIATSFFGVMRVSGDSVYGLAGDVYVGGLPGDAGTNNSAAMATYIYTAGTGPDGGTNLDQIEADIVDADGVNPASYGMDVGSPWDWEPCVPGVQDVMVVLETVNGMNGWTGANATTSSNITLSCGFFDLLPDVNMRDIPTPTQLGQGPDWINITWDAIIEDAIIGPNVANYDVQRAPAIGGPYVSVGTSTDQVPAGGSVYYNDTGLAMGIYYYRIAVNYARGLAGYTTTGLSDAVMAQTDIINNAPTLDWTGEPNYVSDGVDPETGVVASTVFTFRVQYFDADDNPPAAGYPKVFIEQPLGTPVGASPFAMTEVNPLDVVYTDGKNYTYSTTLPAAANDYWYCFNATDGFDWATGPPVTCIDAPDVTGANNAPTLDWTGEPNYVTDGLDPETGTMATTFTYRIQYFDADDNPPAAGHPRVFIEQPLGTPVGASPFPMTEVDALDTTYTDGKNYTYSTTLPAVANDYFYFFNASDGTDWATGTPLTAIDAPDVIANTAPALDWTGEANYVSDGLDPETGLTTTTFTYRIEYTDADNNPPAAGHPRVFIEQPLGTPVGASPFPMTEVDPADVTYTDGKLYTFSTTLTTAATDYNYFFNASDTLDWATGTPTTAIDAPDVTAPDTTAPSITNVDVDPTSPATGDDVTISATITDASGVDTITIIVTDPDGNVIVTNLTMTPGTGTDVYEYTISGILIDKGGFYDYEIWANDTNGNIASDTGLFFVTEISTVLVVILVQDADGNNISGATVTIELDGTSVASGSTVEGAFLANLAPGDYKVKATKSGYKDASKDITVAGPMPELHTITMDKEEDMLWIWIIIIIIIVILVIILLLWLLRKKPEEKPEEEAKLEEMEPVEGEAEPEVEGEAAAVGAAAPAAAATTKTCVSCGREIKVDFDLCPFCGAHQTEAKPETTEEAAEEPKAEEPAEEAKTEEPKGEEEKGKPTSCKNCGKEILPGFTICPYCGTSQ